MNPRFLFFVALALLTSCAAPRLQVVTLRSHQVAPRENAFVHETDTLRIAYDFFSPNGSVRFIIRNNWTKPLYLDWSKSAFIVGRDRISYWADGMLLDPALASLQQGNVRPDERVTFIPPGTEIRQVKFLAKPGDQFRFKPTLRPEQDSTQVQNSTGRTITTPLLRYRFEEASSPLIFRNYLTLSTDERFAQEFHLDHEFYASEVEELDGRALFGMNYTPALLNGPLTNLSNRYNAPNKFLLRVRQQ